MMAMMRMKASSRHDLPRQRLLSYDEPRLRFAYNQRLEDPKEGLTLFGPPQAYSGLQYGLVGTSEGIRQFKAWAAKLQAAIPADPEVGSSVMFPGFETVFRTAWPTKPRVCLEVDGPALARTVKLTRSSSACFRYCRTLRESHQAMGDRGGSESRSMVRYHSRRCVEALPATIEG